jgi:hypothetical protein
MDSTRSKNCVKAVDYLKTNGIPLPPHIYTNFAIDSVVSSIQANRNLQRIDSAQKILLGDAYAARLDLKVQNLIGHAYRWLEGIKVKVRVLETEYLGLPIVSGLDAKIQKLYRIFGHSKTKNVYALNLETLTRIISKDPYYPRLITPEAIIRYITKPSVLCNDENIFQGLIATGMLPRIATEFMAHVQKYGNKMVALMELALISVNDGIINQLDLSYATYSKFVRMQSSGNSTVDSILYLILMGYVILLNYRNKDKNILGVDVFLTDKFRAGILTKFSGKSGIYKALKYLDIFNDRVITGDFHSD